MRMATARRHADYTLPGEELAVIEEFDGGEGTYVAGGVVRAAVAGTPAYDLQSRVVRVEAKKPTTRLPKPGDTIVGQVENVQGNIANVKIHYVNGMVSEAGFTGLLIVRQNRFGGRRRPTTYFKAGDIVRARVVSVKNAIIHLSIDRAEDGVVYAVCSLCGGRMAKIDGRIKCVECGGVEERKLAPDFAKLRDIKLIE